MNSVLKFMLPAFTIILSSLGYAQSIQKQDISIFPKPEKGYVQHIIELPYSNNDNSKKIELYVGKTIETDECNHHNLMGSFEENDLKGWGYNYYTFKTKGDVMSTMKGCPTNNKIHQFVRSQSTLLTYNGKLPIVIYTPEGYEVRYKIYQTNGEEYFAPTIKLKN